MNHDLTNPSDGPTSGSAADEVKRELRARLRQVRRRVANPGERSEMIWSHLSATSQYRAAQSVLLFDSIPGEPLTQAWRSAAERAGKRVWIPESSSLPGAADIDLIVVPGVAFTPTGHRLGQGGGWYDRYLAGVAATTSTIGVCFADQLIVALPVEAHDRAVQLVICEHGIATENAAVPDV